MNFNTSWNGNRGRGHAPRSRPRNWRGNYNGPIPGNYGGGPTPAFYGSNRRGFTARGGRGNFNQMFKSPVNNDQYWPPHRSEIFPDSFELDSFTNNRRFLSPPRCRTPPRELSPLPGSEEYMQRDISEKSALLMRELEMEGSSSCIVANRTNSEQEMIITDLTEDDNIKCVQEETILRSNKCKKQPKAQVPTTLDVNEIHTKIIDHISNLSYNKKYNIVNQLGPTGYDFAIQQITRQKRLDLSRALRDMCNDKFKESDESSAVINSIIPDFDIKIEMLPRDLVQQLSTTLDEDIGECLQNAVTVDPEILFQQAADMLTFSDTFDSGTNSPVLLVDEKPALDPHIPNFNRLQCIELDPFACFNVPYTHNQTDEFSMLNLHDSFVTEPAPNNLSDVFRNVQSPVPLFCDVPTFLENEASHKANEIDEDVQVVLHEFSINAPVPHITVPVTSNANKVLQDDEPIILSDICKPSPIVQSLQVIDNVVIIPDDTIPRKGVILENPTISDNIKAIDNTYVVSVDDSPKIENIPDIKTTADSYTESKLVDLTNEKPNVVVVPVVAVELVSEDSSSLDLAKNKHIGKGRLSEREESPEHKHIGESKVEQTISKDNPVVIHKVKSKKIEAKQTAPIKMSEPITELNIPEKVIKKLKVRDEAPSKSNKGSRKYFEGARQEMPSVECARQPSSEMDKVDKSHDKIVEDVRSQSRSVEKDILYKEKYDERQHRYRSGRSRYDKYQSDKYDSEAYKKYHQVEIDRHKESYDKYRHQVYSPDSEHPHPSDLHRYSKHAERDEARHSKRHHSEKRLKYVESNTDYEDKNYDYYRHEIPFSSEQYEEPVHAHHHRHKHSKSLKRSKKHKRRREVSVSSINSNISTNSDGNVLSARSSLQRTPEMLDDRSVIKHKKPLKERIQMLSEVKSFDKKEELYDSIDSRDNSKIKLEPISPIKPSTLPPKLSPKVVKVPKIPVTTVEPTITSKPLVPFTNIPNPNTVSFQESENRHIEMNVSHDKSSPLQIVHADLPEDTTLDESTDNNHLPDTNNIPKIISSLSNMVQPTDYENVEEPKKPFQRPWKSPGEKKFMMEQISKNPPPLDDNDLSPDKVEEKLAFVNPDSHANVVINAACEHATLDNAENVQTETGDFKTAEILHSAEVSSTSDTSGKNPKVEPVKNDTIKSTVVTIAIPKIPKADKMLITTYTQTDPSVPKKEDKRNSNSRKKHRLYNIGIQVGVSHTVSSTQTQALKCKSVLVQADRNKTATCKTAFVQTEPVGIYDCSKCENYDNEPKQTLKAKRRQNAVQRMMDIDSEIQRLTMLRQSFYNYIEGDSISEDEYEEKPNSKKRIRKMPSTDKLNREISPKPEKKKTKWPHKASLPARSNSKRSKREESAEPEEKKRKYNRRKSPDPVSDEKDSTVVSRKLNDFSDNSNESNLTYKHSNDITPEPHDTSALTEQGPVTGSRPSDNLSKDSKKHKTPDVSLSTQDSIVIVSKTKKGKSKGKRAKRKTVLAKQKILDVEDIPKHERSRLQRGQSLITTDSKLDETKVENDTPTSKHLKNDVSLMNNDDEENSAVLLKTTETENVDQTDIIVQEPLDQKSNEEPALLTDSERPKTPHVSPTPCLVNLSDQHSAPTPKTKKGKKKRNRTKSVLAEQSTLSVEHPPPLERTRLRRRQSLISTDYEFEVIQIEKEKPISGNGNEEASLIGDNRESADQSDIVVQELPNSVEENQLETVKNTLETKDSSQVDSEDIYETIPEPPPALTIDYGDSEKPASSKDDSEEEVLMALVKQVKTKKKKKIGPLSRTRQKGQSVAVQEILANPSCVSIVKIARYSIPQLEELRSNLRNKDSAAETVLNNSVVSNISTESETVATEESVLNEDIPVVLSEAVLPVIESDSGDVATGGSTEAIVQEEFNSPLFFKGFTGAVLVIKVINETVLAATDNGEVLFFNMADCNITHMFDISRLAITSMLVIKHNDIDHVYVGSLNMSLSVINFNSKEVSKTEQMIEPIQCMENAWNYIFIGSDRGSLIRFELNSEKVEDVIKIAATNILSIKATNEGTRKVLVVATRNEPVSIRDACSGLLLRSLQTPFLPTVYTILSNFNLIYCGTSQHDILVYTFESSGFQESKF